MAALTRDDVVGLLKPAEVIVVVQILATGATKEEFAEAYVWRGSDQCRPEPPVRTAFEQFDCSSWHVIGELASGDWSVSPV
jgi:hypothetical protein